MSEPEDLRDALDALEAMVAQYLDGDPETGFDHSFMTAGEQASEVLARLRPGRWELTPCGIEPGERFNDECAGTHSVAPHLDRPQTTRCPECGRMTPTYRGMGHAVRFMRHPAGGSWVMQPADLVRPPA